MKPTSRLIKPYHVCGFGSSAQPGRDLDNTSTQPSPPKRYRHSCPEDVLLSASRNLLSTPRNPQSTIDGSLLSEFTRVSSLSSCSFTFSDVSRLSSQPEDGLPPPPPVTVSTLPPVFDTESSNDTSSSTLRPLFPTTSTSANFDGAVSPKVKLFTAADAYYSTHGPSNISKIGHLSEDAKQKAAVARRRQEDRRGYSLKISGDNDPRFSSSPLNTRRNWREENRMLRQGYIQPDVDALDLSAYNTDLSLPRHPTRLPPPLISGSESSLVDLNSNLNNIEEKSEEQQQVNMSNEDTPTNEAQNCGTQEKRPPSNRGTAKPLRSTKSNVYSYFPGLWEEQFSEPFCVPDPKIDNGHKDTFSSGSTSGRKKVKIPHNYETVYPIDEYEVEYSSRPHKSTQTIGPLPPPPREAKERKKCHYPSLVSGLIDNVELYSEEGTMSSSKILQDYERSTQAIGPPSGAKEQTLIDRERETDIYDENTASKSVQTDELAAVIPIIDVDSIDLASPSALVVTSLEHDNKPSHQPGGKRHTAPPGLESPHLDDLNDAPQQADAEIAANHKKMTENFCLDESAMPRHLSAATASSNTLSQQSSPRSLTVSVSPSSASSSCQRLDQASDSAAAGAGSGVESPSEVFSAAIDVLEEEATTFGGEESDAGLGHKEQLPEFLHLCDLKSVKELRKQRKSERESHNGGEESLNMVNHIEAAVDDQPNENKLNVCKAVVSVESEDGKQDKQTSPDQVIKDKRSSSNPTNYLHRTAPRPPSRKYSRPSPTFSGLYRGSLYRNFDDFISHVDDVSEGLKFKSSSAPIGRRVARNLSAPTATVAQRLRIRIRPLSRALVHSNRNSQSVTPSEQGSSDMFDTALQLDRVGGMSRDSCGELIHPPTSIESDSLTAPSTTSPESSLALSAPPPAPAARRPASILSETAAGGTGAGSDRDSLSVTSEDWGKVSMWLSTYGGRLTAEEEQFYEEQLIEILQPKSSSSGLSEWLKSLSEAGVEVNSSSSSTSTVTNLSHYEDILVTNGYDHLSFLSGGILERCDLETIGIDDVIVQDRLLEAVITLPLLLPQGDFVSVPRWLESLHLGQYSDDFTTAGYISMESLEGLWDLELQTTLGVVLLGHRKRILAAVTLITPWEMVLDNSEYGRRSPSVPVFSPQVSNSSDGRGGGGFRAKENGASSSSSSAAAARNNSLFATFSQLDQDLDSLDLLSLKSELNLFKDYTTIRSSCRFKSTTPPPPPPLQQQQPVILPIETLVKGCYNFVVKYLGCCEVHSDSDRDGDSRELDERDTQNAIGRIRDNLDQHQQQQPRMGCDYDTGFNLPVHPPQSSFSGADVQLSVSYRGVKFYDLTNKALICQHDVSNIFCACQDSDNLSHFAYITLDSRDSLFYCQSFAAYSQEGCVEILNTLVAAFHAAFEFLPKD